MEVQFDFAATAGDWNKALRLKAAMMNLPFSNVSVSERVKGIHDDCNSLAASSYHTPRRGACQD